MCCKRPSNFKPTFTTNVISWLLYITVFVVSVSIPEVIASNFEECPPDFLLLSGKCYYFSDNPSTWHEARHECVLLDSALATLETEEEDLAVRKHIDEDESVGYWWTSGNKLNGEDSWAWNNTKKPFDYFNWCMDCPSEENNSSCLLVGVNCWEDHKCYEQFRDRLPIHFICERTPVQNDNEMDETGREEL